MQAIEQDCIILHPSGIATYSRGEEEAQLARSELAVSKSASCRPALVAASGDEVSHAMGIFERVFRSWNHLGPKATLGQLKKKEQDWPFLTQALVAQSKENTALGLAIVEALNTSMNANNTERWVEKDFTIYSSEMVGLELDKKEMRYMSLLRLLHTTQLAKTLHPELLHRVFEKGEQLSACFSLARLYAGADEDLCALVSRCIQVLVEKDVEDVRAFLDKLGCSVADGKGVARLYCRLGWILVDLVFRFLWFYLTCIVKWVGGWVVKCFWP